MSSIKLTENVYSVGVLNPNLRVFDIVMRTEYGTSYNSYIIKGEKNILIETCHGKFYDEFLENISQVIDPATIDYIILNHTEPDHSGALDNLTKLNPNAQIICSQSASLFLKNITNNKDLNLRIVKDKETLEVGNIKLEFINAPFLHWPDSMFTYYTNENILFSCDFFGSHYCEPRMLDSVITDKTHYEQEFKNYYGAIFGPFKPHVLNGLEKIKDLDIDLVCPSHGPVLTKGCLIDFVKEKYNEWSQPHINEKLEIPVFYCTAYGNTRQIAEAIKDGILVSKPDANVTLFDLVGADMCEMSHLLNSSDAFLIGTPTINKDAVPPVWMLLSHIDAINFAKRPCAVFGSFGWSGEGIPAVAQRLSTLKAKVFETNFKVQFVPSEQDLENAKLFGTEFAQTL